MTWKSISEVDLSTNPSWANVRSQTFAEKRVRERGWDDRHATMFSTANPKVHPNLRDYFDRRRDFDDTSRADLWPRDRLFPHWRLGEHALSHTTGSLEEMRSAFDSPQRRPIRRDWNDRHHVTGSVANRQTHDSLREYFGRYVPPRSTRLLPHPQKGITRHSLPYAMRGNEFGRDDGPSDAEILVSSTEALPA
eukprot:CAMPEP_0178422730 /NCGR_PEP_ID=MMETSP0689_2-20121128/27325_1 /TAXON_ID=160604 /ORGANISM="Amphidinium massartii, Strain CS-259" /LENGTH=192 /DNA_ID=CAMNT_0020044305 /DNA_START=144 /DNA_END=718 /DNA_ORIENTATION=-